jgi:hypothetical protein
MRIFKLLIPALVLLCMSCAVQTTAIPFGEHRYKPKPKDAVIDVLLKEPTRPYELIGMITVKKQATLRFETISEEELYPALIDEARKLGADAIIDIKFEIYEVDAVFSTHDKDALKASAKAIRYSIK